LSDFDQSLIKPSRDLQSSCLDLEECFDICAGKRDFSAGEPQVCECVCGCVCFISMICFILESVCLSLSQKNSQSIIFQSWLHY